ncbi:YfbM family protein [Micromonospora sp. LOL_024]|uniref:YfbM family protein n=1 Tax=Micromonospora sp. LOL_024 TaxID=3345412 RepID=UPI003A894973
MHFAIAADQERALLTAGDRGDSDSVGEILENIEESWSDDGLKVDTDKAWSAIHRCLTDGTVDADTGVYPLSHAVLGGRHLHDEYPVVYLSATEVRDVAHALRDVEPTWLRSRFDAINDPDYLGAHDDTDFAYTWDAFTELQAFYDRAAANGRAVIFTAT